MRRVYGSPWYKGQVADRVRLPDSVVDKLYFAQVREDPVLEIEALQPRPEHTIVVVGSGGCTALSLLSAGAGQVVAVDLNRVQNNLTELKAAAVRTLTPAEAVGFLGGAPMSARERGERYRAMAPDLGQEARDWWNGHPRQLARGILGAGVTERFIGGVITAMRVAVHPPGRIRRLLACITLDEQRELFRREWDTARWRLFFTLSLIHI